MAVFPLREWGASNRYIMLHPARRAGHKTCTAAGSHRAHLLSLPAEPQQPQPRSHRPVSTHPPPQQLILRGHRLWQGGKPKGNCCLAAFEGRISRFLLTTMSPELLMQKCYRLLSLRPLTEGPGAKHQCLSGLETSASIVQFG